MQQIGFWNKLVAHPAYDAFWSDQAVDKLLAAQPLQVPVMLVHSLWDQEDSYGALAMYAAIKPKDTRGDMVKLVMGPWYHGQEIEEGSALGAIRFGSDTAQYFREQVLRPFLAQYLKDGAAKADVAPVTAYETGTNQWRRLDRWPLVCDSGCPVKSRPLYLQPDRKLGFTSPASGPAFSEFVSDPSHPVPFRARPIQPIGYDPGQTWSQWLVDDQREASGRPDVLTFTSDVLTAPVKVSGRPNVHLVASTTGTDADWVVKLIDVYPEKVDEDWKLSGFELMIADEIFRGRYRNSYEKPEAITPNQVTPFTVDLHSTNHVFKKGHRIMVQVQSTWFPLYDRNPQKFVPNIFEAKDVDYQKATQSIYRSKQYPSSVEVMVLPSSAAK
jgi:putative CocE/NonD family hydrolase